MASFFFAHNFILLLTFIDQSADLLLLIAKFLLSLCQLLHIALLFGLRFLDLFLHDSFELLVGFFLVVDLLLKLLHGGLIDVHLAEIPGVNTGL